MKRHQRKKYWIIREDDMFTDKMRQIDINEIMSTLSTLTFFLEIGSLENRTA